MNRNHTFLKLKRNYKNYWMKEKYLVKFKKKLPNNKRVILIINHNQIKELKNLKKN